MWLRRVTFFWRLRVVPLPEPRKLVSCDGCGGGVFVGDVFKQVPIPNAPQHLAVVFKCGFCGLVDKAATTVEDWEFLQAELVETVDEVERLMAVFVFDLEAVDSLADLELFWSGGPAPIREGWWGPVRCCGSCDRDRGLSFGVS